MSEEFKIKPSRNIDVFEAFHSAIHHYIDERAEQLKRQKMSSLMDRFIFKVRETLQNQGSNANAQKRLTGRINELNRNATDVLDYLVKVKQLLKSEVEAELVNYVDAVMDPMIREIERIRSMLRQDRSVMTHPEDSLKKYTDWISRAKLWVEICSAKKDKETITKAILEYTVADFAASIERDLKLICDYQEHVLANFDLAQREETKETISPRIAPYMNSLIGLVEKPDNLNLENFQEWRSVAEKKRDHFFNVILQIIDNIADEISATSTSVESQEDIIHILKKMAYLESEIPVFCYGVLNNEIVDEEEREMQLPQLEAFIDQVNTLYFDIRMPQDIVERLIYLRDTLNNAADKLENR